MHPTWPPPHPYTMGRAWSALRCGQPGQGDYAGGDEHESQFPEVPLSYEGAADEAEELITTLIRENVEDVIRQICNMMNDPGTTSPTRRGLIELHDKMVRIRTALIELELEIDHWDGWEE